MSAGEAQAVVAAAARVPAGFKTVAEGVATTIWCATSVALDGLGGIYCEDCDIAVPVPADHATGAATSTRGYARTPSARSRREKSQVACPVVPAYTPTMVTLRIPEDVLSTLGPDPEAAAGELRVLAAMKLFELGRVSSGAAAAIAGMPRVGFLAKLGEYGVSPFQVTPTDLEHDLDVARRAARD
jgi:predicted HTH domain antitoxin